MTKKNTPKLPRGKYRDALDWIVLNDDTEWLDNDDPMSVTLSLVADLWGLSSEQAVADLRTVRTHLLPNSHPESR